MTIEHITIDNGDGYASALYHINGQIVFINYQHNVNLYPLPTTITKIQYNEINVVLRLYNLPIRYMWRAKQPYIEVCFNYGRTNLLTNAKWIILKNSLAVDVKEDV